MIRAIILAITAAAAITTYLDRPAPVKAVQVDYCVIDERAAGKDQLGVMHFFWSEGYGPCSLQDRFRDI